MELALIITGIVTIIVGIIAGIGSGSFSSFIIFLTSGAAISVILFAFSQVISNQLDILYQLKVHNEFTSQLHTKEIKCPNCDYVYGDSYSSCPNCGNRRSK